VDAAGLGLSGLSVRREHDTSTPSEMRDDADPLAEEAAALKTSETRIVLRWNFERHKLSPGAGIATGCNVCRLTTRAPYRKSLFIDRRMMVNVLLAGQDAPLGNSVLHLLAKVAIVGEWVRSSAELDAWAARRRPLAPRLVILDWELPGAAAGAPLGVLQSLVPSATIVVLSHGLSGDDAAVLLSRGVPSIHKPVNPFVLSMMALDLSTEASPPSSASVPAAPVETSSRPELAHPDRSFDSVVAAYATSRRLSKQQALILDLYLNGKTDKEIAELCACSGATVYEHWRRMARKSGGRQKGDLIADFHRYLRHGPAASAPLGICPSEVCPSDVPPSSVCLSGVSANAVPPSGVSRSGAAPGSACVASVGVG
jgi:DNA-binding NarL/FixJ family response regulator